MSRILLVFLALLVPWWAPAAPPAAPAATHTLYFPTLRSDPGKNLLIYRSIIGGDPPRQGPTTLTTRTGAAIRELWPTHLDELSWAPDRNRVASVRDGRLITIDLWSSQVVTLTTSASPDRPQMQSAAWSPDGRQLALSADRGLYVINQDGTGLRQLLGRPQNNERVYYWWSFDSRQIVTASQLGVSVVNRDGTGLRQLSTQRAFVAWSPRARRLTLASTEACTLYDIERGRQQTIGAPGCFAVWSPDGAQIAVADTDGLHRVDAASGARTRLLTYGTNPEWSPDGQRLAFDWPPGGFGVATASDVYVLTLASGALTRLSNTPGLSEVTMSWSPTGQRLLYKVAPPASPAGHFIVHDFAADRSQRLGCNEVPSNSSWAADGSALVYDCSIGNGRAYETRIVYLEPTLRVITLLGERPVWSPF